MGTFFDIIGKYGYVYANGLIGTLWLAAVTVVAGTLIGVLLALLRLSGLKFPEAFVKTYVWILRGTPILLQLYFFWIFLPRVIPIDLSDTACIVTALIVNSSAYVSEIIRAGIQAVDRGQEEAARSLGLRRGMAMRHVILPQAIKNILPALGNEFINMIKQVSLASVFFINELTTSYRTVLSATYRPIESILIAGMIYLLLTTVLTEIMNRFEARLRVGEA